MTVVQDKGSRSAGPFATCSFMHVSFRSKGFRPRCYDWLLNSEDRQQIMYMANGICMSLRYGLVGRHRRGSSDHSTLGLQSHVGHYRMYQLSDERAVQLRDQLQGSC